MRAITPSSSSSPAGPPTTRTCAGSWPSVRTARRKFAASTASLSRSRIARHSPGPWWRSNGSQPPGPSTASMPAAEAGAGTSRKPLVPSSASNRRPPSIRTHGPRLTQSAAARGMPSISATAAVSSSPAPAATTLAPITSPPITSPPITSMVPASRSTTTASLRAPGVVRAPSRAAAGSATGLCTGMSSRSVRMLAASSSPTRLSKATSTARPVLPCRAVAASAAAARSTANRSSTSTSAPAPAPAATAPRPNARTAPTGQSASRAHAARSGRQPSAVITHGSARLSGAAGAVSRPTTAFA